MSEEGAGETASALGSTEMGRGVVPAPGPAHPGEKHRTPELGFCFLSSGTKDWLAVLKTLATLSSKENDFVLSV